MKIMTVENNVLTYISRNPVTEIVARVPMFDANTSAYMAKYIGKDDTFGFGRKFMSRMRHSNNNICAAVEFAWVVEESGVYEIRVRFFDKDTGVILHDEREVICYDGCDFVTINNKDEILFAIEHPDEYVAFALGNEETEEENV